jgi:hypothetical protein
MLHHYEKSKQLKINAFLSFFSFFKLSLLLICFNIGLFRFTNPIFLILMQGVFLAQRLLFSGLKLCPQVDYAHIALKLFRSSR